MGPKAKLEIFSRCKSHLDDADMLIALLDGSQVDDGLHGKSAISTPENHPNRKLSVSGLISAGQNWVAVTPGYIRNFSRCYTPIQISPVLTALFSASTISHVDGHPSPGGVTLQPGYPVHILAGTGLQDRI
jgi:hypothetical protein